jgi:hypothetical protein
MRLSIKRKAQAQAHAKERTTLEALGMAKIYTSYKGQTYISFMGKR